MSALASGVTFGNSHKRSRAHPAIQYQCIDICRYKKRPNAATITLLYCLRVLLVEINSCSESGTYAKCDLFLTKGGCFSTPSFHPETKTGCDPPSASGPGSVKETLHRQGSCIDVQVLIYLLCNHNMCVLCCAVLCVTKTHFPTMTL